MKRSLHIALVSIILGSTAYAQDKIKDGTVSGSANTPKLGALLDLESNNRALLLTRVSLTATTTWGLNGTAPAEGGYTVFNTNSSITGTTAYPTITGGVGLYYWDGTGWVATKQLSNYIEPWNIQNSTNSARLNNQNIYQMGTVAIGLNNAYTGASLHVQGAVRGGVRPSGTVGANSASFGADTEASGGSSFSVGFYSTASGLRSVAMGDSTSASGLNSTAFGKGTQARGSRSTAFGYNTIVGVDANNGTAFGYDSKALGNNSTAFGYSTEARGIRGTAFGYNSITGVNATDATAFGLNTRATGDASTAFGNSTSSSGSNSTSFGYSTTASEDRSTAFGNTTIASGPSSTAFGALSRATSERATAFGYDTRANGETSTAFGSGSIANGLRSTVFGNGATTSVDGINAVSIGTSTSANHTNALVIGNNVTSTADNQLSARFQGGYRFMTQAQSVSNIGAQLANGANAWSVMSSKALKENFQLVDGKQILSKIVNLELTSWNYIGQDKSKLRHYGPMAEDFFEAFGNDGVGTIGHGDSINQADFDGINLIAIQALAKENLELKARIEKLEKLILEKK